MTADLSTTYLGLTLKSPVVASSSPLTGDLDSLWALADAGAGAVVLPSMFEEQIEQEAIELQRLYEAGTGSFAEALSGYLPDMQSYNTGPEKYLDHLGAAKESLAIPVIPSLNGTTRGGWVKYAKRLEAVGADAIELNIYLLPTDPYADGRDVEQRYLDLVEAVRAAVDVPLAVKIGPYFSAMISMARRLAEAGADALVLFNRFYQPDIDLEALEVVPNLKLSAPVELRLPLRWVALLHGQVRSNLAVTSGVHSGDDVVKALLVGADVAMVASALLRNGVRHMATIVDDLQRWLEEHEYESVDQLRGSMSVAKAPNPDQFVRSNYMTVLRSYTAKNV